jgi:hypothetical protein
MKNVLIGMLVLLILGSAVAPAQMNGVNFIVSKPPITAKLGVPYTYQVVIQDPRMTPVMAKWKYFLDRAPVGMTIDTMGLVTWTPIKSGFFSVRIVVTDSRLKFCQDFVIQVIRVNGTITGVIKNEDGQPYRGVVVSVISAALINMIDPAIRIMPMPIPPQVKTDSLGAFTITGIDSGSYYLRASAFAVGPMSSVWVPMSVTRYYVNSPDIQGATTILITDETPFTANMTLPKLVPPTIYTLSGKVSAVDGRAIAGANVALMMAPKSPAPNGPNDPPEPFFCDPTFGMFPIGGGKAVTDQNGLFSIRVPAGGPYIVAAFAKGYELMYYNNKKNALEADKIDVKDNVTGVDFVLVPLPVPPTPVAKVSGAVVDSLGVGVLAKAVLFHVGPMLMNMRPMVRSIHTDSLGKFVFEKVPNGKYILQVMPFRGYMPAFYKANDCGIRNPLKADTIVVNNADVAGLVVCVKNVYSLPDGGRVSGKITTQDGLGLAGVVVAAESQASADIRSFGVTTADGSYEIPDLPAGAYMLRAEKVGYSAAEISSNLDPTLLAATANMQMVPLGTTGVHSDGQVVTPTSFHMDANYPNPFNPTTNIRFTLPEAGFTTLKIYDINGRVVSKLVEGTLVAGEHIVTFNATTATLPMPSGIYLYQLRFNGKSLVNKMLLMK